MNYAPQILNCLTQADGPLALLLAPNAPPVARNAAGLSVALHDVLDAGDVLDTLVALGIQAGKTSEETYPAYGTFSIAMRGVGRIRVNHFTQRGSKLLKLTRIPFKVPQPEAICEDQAVLARLMDFVLSPQGGFLAICGPNAWGNSLLAYSLLWKVNQTTRRVVYVLEPELSFLMAHADSIVIQSEVGTDVPTIEEGLQNAVAVDPDIFYVGDFRSANLVAALRATVHPGMVGIVTSSLFEARVLVRALRVADAARGVAPVGLPGLAVTAALTAAGKVGVQNVELSAAQ
jgi:twitching motility protein PilT